MKILFNKKFLEHNKNSEAEGPYRLKEFKDIENTYVDGEKWITLVHPEDYKEEIRKACFENRVIAEVELTPDTWEAACLSVGLTVKASEDGDFAAVRPPGHHAGFERPAGFCLFNNIAIAAQKLVNEGKKVFILDIDGHHGDGTQNIFYESDKVFYCSIHQEFAYPFTGFPTEVGSGKGVGYTLNFPLMSGKGDADLLDRVDKAIVKARKFQPDVIGVSVGFDGYVKDRLLQLNFTRKGYYECAFRIKKNFRRVPVFAVLEGGYHYDVRQLADVFVEGVNNGGKAPRMKYNEDMAIG
ncbi:MAG: histone deacetylase [Chlorobi bacterium]|nr:histone deacetylase [Chlorobiota bacterium]